jgi:hypothetical protein
MRRDPYIAAGWLLVLLILASCGTQPENPPQAEILLSTPVQISTPCDMCDQETLAAVLTQEQNNADIQAAATAEIVRANAQATWDSANAQATVNSAGSTQSSALTQDAIRQTQMADLATTRAEAVMTQQNKDDLAAGTQTAIANNIATQTQVAVATSQWYADQTRQREEQRQGPIAFLWMWCFPLFVLLLAVLVLWGIWRWQKIQQANQRILENSVDKLPAPVVEGIDHHDHLLPYLESDIVDSGYQVTTPDDQVHQWLDEVKRNLLDSDKKDEEDGTDN